MADSDSCSIVRSAELLTSQEMSKYADAFKQPAGPGDARPTALDIVKDDGLTGKLQGKVFLITGCSSGLGVETARALYTTGADLYLTVRDLKKGAEVVSEIHGSEGGSHGKIELLHLELDSLQSVRECAADFLKKSKQLNVLIKNAGVMACPEGQTKDGFETQIGVNHLAHFLLFKLLEPTLLASSTPDFNSRVVCLSSSGHQVSGVQVDDLNFKTRKYDPWTAYYESKSANILMANEIERRYGSQGLHATSVHPGGIATPLARHIDQEAFGKMFTPAIQLKMKSPEQGAATTVWAAIGKEWEGTGGKYLEDCSVGVPMREGKRELLQGGYAPHAYDEEAAKKLWDLSLKLVGLEK